ncbi:hypothetical protein PFJ87_10g00800 [Encephalitozoon hellem]|uniref:Uncharacterized protein n=1 Tax=Encephalitozoon hellem TaxID=27973 RepID=A0ABY8CL32_ENCHE|nr:hypothetical protein PFJ87_10g00800 [Encephalitozoon hellem]
MAAESICEPVNKSTLYRKSHLMNLLRNLENVKYSLSSMTFGRSILKREPRLLGAMREICSHVSFLALLGYVLGS